MDHIIIISNTFSVQFFVWQICTTAAHYIIHCLRLNNNDNQMDIVYMDFKKMFDSVPHDKLLVKLKSTGIHRNLLSWFKFYEDNLCGYNSFSKFCNVLSVVETLTHQFYFAWLVQPWNSLLAISINLPLHIIKSNLIEHF